MQPLRYDLWFLALACLLGLLLPWLRPLTGTEGTLPWLLDLASHWQWLFAAGLALTALGGAWRERRWLLALLAVPLPWLSAAPVLPSGSGEGPQLRVASANLHLDSTDLAPLAAWLEQARPDLVVLLEVSPRYARELEKLPGYPHRLVHAEHSPFGIALLSRLPLEQGHKGRDDQGIVHLRAQLEFAGCALSMTAFHPMPPLLPEDQARRDRLLKQLIQASGADPRPARRRSQRQPLVERLRRPRSPRLAPRQRPRPDLAKRGAGPGRHPHRPRAGLGPLAPAQQRARPRPGLRPPAGADARRTGRRRLSLTLGQGVEPDQSRVTGANGIESRSPGHCFEFSGYRARPNRPRNILSSDPL